VPFNLSDEAVSLQNLRPGRPLNVTSKGHSLEEVPTGKADRVVLLRGSTLRYSHQMSAVTVEIVVIALYGGRKNK
jgi:hypothetical protein